MIIVAVVVVAAGVIVGIKLCGSKTPEVTTPPTETPKGVDTTNVANPQPIDTPEVEKPKPVKVDPPKPITGRGTVDLGYGIYTGELKNGVPHGHGVIKYTQKHKIVSSKDFVANPGDEFEADFRDGRVSGNIGYWSHDGNKTAIKP